MRSDDEKKNELIADVYRADRVYEAEMRSPIYRAKGEEAFEFIGKELFRKGYRRASEVAREISQDIIEPLWNAYKNSTCQETVLLVALICETINNQLKKKYTEVEG